MTDVVSDKAVEVDGMPRHIKNLGHRTLSRRAANDISEQIDEAKEEMTIHLHPQGAADADRSANPPLLDLGAR
ncbi:hypothetical protein T4A_10926 [Trichinella pseudospiralis]|uniref:Uncharacterized protein n=1 Tax=Trichinella pseudospiralis TaxID=6337 RepID=A0A0V1EGI9_TRIPS|nr:hypothetical protein T4A_10926 [Trichinella pseudospiralis]